MVFITEQLVAGQLSLEEASKAYLQARQEYREKKKNKPSVAAISTLLKNKPEYQQAIAKIKRIKDDIERRAAIDREKQRRMATLGYMP